MDLLVSEAQVNLIDSRLEFLKIDANQFFHFELCFLNTGGLGGMTGYYRFVQTGNQTNRTPKNVRNNGNEGSKGSDGRICRTIAKKVNVNSLHHVYMAVVVPMFTINTEYSSYDIDDPNCHTDLVRTHETIQPQNPVKHLNVALATSEYKNVLLQNSENPALSSMLQKAIDAIDSVV